MDWIRLTTEQWAGLDTEDWCALLLDASAGPRIALALGGEAHRELTIVNSVPGVVPLAVQSLAGPGAGLLTISADASGLAWQEPGATSPGPAIDVSAGGPYYLPGSDYYRGLLVAVYPPYLVPAGQVQVSLADVDYGPEGETSYATPGVAGWDATADQVENVDGDVANWLLTINNTSALSAPSAVAWIDSAAAATLELSLDGATWSAPTTEGSGLALGTIAAAGSLAIHVRRTIAAFTDAADRQLVLIHVSWDEPDGTRGKMACRGIYRIFGQALMGVYGGATPPAAGDLPVFTRGEPYLPATYAWTIDPDETLYLSLSLSNGIYDSGFAPVGTNGETYRRLDFAGGVSILPPPNGPQSWSAAGVQLPGGPSVRIFGQGNQGDRLRPDEWSVQYQVNAGAWQEITAPFAGVLAILNVSLPAGTDGDVVTVHVRSRRNDGSDTTPAWTYSINSDTQTITLGSAGPTAPLTASEDALV